MNKLRAFLRDAEEGQAIVLVAIVMLGMLFAVGLSVDSGQLFNGRRTAQEAADAAAFAGATVLYQGGSSAQAISAATSDAALNGYATDTPTSGTTVTVNNPPTSGAHAGQALYVEVIILTPVRTSLVPQQASFTTIRARAVGGAVSVNSGYAIMSLNQACANNSISVSSNGSLDLSGGGILVNSCGATAASNSGTVTIEEPYGTDVVGGASGTWPNLETGQAVRPDPLAGLAKPSVNGLTTYSPACPPSINQPGIYTTTFSSNCDYVFAPGTYIFKGGGINLAGNSSMCTGPACTTPTAAGGVFFFLTSSTYPATGGSCAEFSLHGNNSSNLSPPTSGTYQGLLIYVDNNCSITLSVGGNGAITTTGTIYAPNVTIAGDGNNAVVQASQIITKTLTAQNADFTITYDDSLTYQGKTPSLVE